MKKLSLGFIVMMLLAAGQAKADVIYDTFGTSLPLYNNAAGWTIGTFTNYWQGDAFTPTSNYTLTDFEVAMSYNGGTNAVNFKLFTDTAGEPGSLIESYSVTNLQPFGSASNSVVSFDSTTHPELLAGDQYWLIAEPPDSTTWDVWNLSSDPGLHAASLDNGATWENFSDQDQGAFLVDGTLVSGGPVGSAAVPEPATWGLLAAGLSGLLLRRRLAK